MTATRTVFLIIWFLALAASVAASVFTYVNTPDVESFRSFAEPSNSKFEGKITYLFLPVVGMAIVIAFGVFRIPEFQSDKGFMRALLVTGFVALWGVGVWLNCSRALGQADAVARDLERPAVEQEN